MNLFNWKKKEEPKLFKYAGIKDCIELRNNLDRFFTLHNSFTDLKKVFTYDELDLISTKLSINGEINVKDSFIWLELDEYNRYIERSKHSISLKLERVAGERKISINEPLLNFLWIPELEKNKLIEQLKNVINECEKDVELNKKEIYLKSIPSDKYLELYGEDDYFTSTLFTLKIRNFNIWHHNELNIITLKDEFIEFNTNFEIELEDPKIKLKFLTLNLIRKLKSKIIDINDTEEQINNELTKISDYNNNPIGYDIISALFNLGLFYFENNEEKSDFYFNKISLSQWSELSNNTISNYFRKIGDLYFEKSNFSKAVFWYEKGLEINPKLSVIKILNKLKKELH
jgi:hypothetical protein